MTTWFARDTRISLDRPVVMGILNVTPDSFSDGGLYDSVDNAVERARTMRAEGADIVDIGGESTRPQGARPVDEREEIARVVPVIQAIVRELPGTIVSVDTVKSTVARAAVDTGARIVNDVSGLRLDRNMARTCAELGAGVVIMHSRGGVADMATFLHARYEDVEREVRDELRRQIDVALAAGIRRECIAVDPGIGFSKRSEHSLRMLAGIDDIAEWGFPVLIGVSRKRFIGELTSRTVASERVFGSIGAAVAAFDRGARIFRVHDVRATREALDVAAAIRRAGAADSSHALGMTGGADNR